MSVVLVVRHPPPHSLFIVLLHLFSLQCCQSMFVSLNPMMSTFLLNIMSMAIVQLTKKSFVLMPLMFW